ncbi:acyl-CoA dehydrogenase family protein [Methylocystis sp. JR02]|uniref:acyl-CoA dehydrogenase family protein n=1 Tax=Methylocystis sp. JR02 TaxID=3046284 RepID=UPI0024B8EEB4|nr:acyl-CoA dehydrogenase family protein [Methylocystis sp. JR02]MDJ0447201.1 acyl-CoA dehydrogenase family protein [Methylocystis sp. JR02]
MLAAEISKPQVRAQEDFSARIASAVAVAAKFAEAVDETARFPKEAFDELKAQRLLGISLPEGCGGEDRNVADAAQLCYALGRVCSSTAMIYAMHAANVACIMNHAGRSERFQSYLRRIGEEQMLLASSTTEGKNGANVRSSASAIVALEDGISLDRDASVVSYGAAADAIVTTARRSPDSLPSDQVLALFFKEDYTLERTSKWDVMGMRGTCSEGFHLIAKGEAEQVLAEPYDKIHRRSMVPVTHLLWASCWAGVAAGAVERAQNFTRKISRAQKGALPPGAPFATQASLSLMQLVNLVDSATADYLGRVGNPESLDEMSFQTSLNLLKVSASEMAIATVMHAFNACGIAGYRNDSEFSVSRPLRDILSSSVMINNNRILSNVATSCLIGGVPEAIVKPR